MDIIEPYLLTVFRAINREGQDRSFETVLQVLPQNRELIYESFLDHEILCAIINKIYIPKMFACGAQTMVRQFESHLSSTCGS